MSSARTLGKAMHDARCAGANDYCTGSHMPSWVNHAKTVLAATDPAEALHDVMCDAEYDTTSPNGCGTARWAHVEMYRGWLRRQGVTA